MESPNQYLSPEPFFARIAPTSFEIQGSEVCSTIRPLPQAQQAQAGQFMDDWLVVLKNTVKVNFLKRCRRAGNWNVSPKSGVAVGGLAQGAMTQTGASGVGGGLRGSPPEQQAKLRGGARPLWGGSQWE